MKRIITGIAALLIAGAAAMPLSASAAENGLTAVQSTELSSQGYWRHRGYYGHRYGGPRRHGGYYAHRRYWGPRFGYRHWGPRYYGYSHRHWGPRYGYYPYRYRHY